MWQQVILCSNFLHLNVDCFPKSQLLAPTLETTVSMYATFMILPAKKKSDYLEVQRILFLQEQYIIW